MIRTFVERPGAPATSIGVDGPSFFTSPEVMTTVVMNSASPERLSPLVGLSVMFITLPFVVPSVMSESSVAAPSPFLTSYQPFADRTT